MIIKIGTSDASSRQRIDSFPWNGTVPLFNSLYSYKQNLRPIKTDLYLDQQYGQSFPRETKACSAFMTQQTSSLDSLICYRADAPQFYELFLISSLN